ncbi:MAG TPA: ribonuclease III [Thermoanaerobaculia bacterium]|nr:ribonuclease III [Thermoanaerobaculia bacterium]
MSEQRGNLDAFEQRLGYRFRRRELLVRALTHKSFAHEARAADSTDNETFEFLGDAVLGLVIGDLLFHRFDALDEGALSKMKAYLVSAPVLARKARMFRMGDVLMLGIGEEKSGGRNKDSLLANLFEAVVAAIYLDDGLPPVRGLIEATFADDLDAIDHQDLLFHDYKTALQEVAQGMGLPLPDYSVVDEIGPDHEKRFVVEVRLANRIAARGEGTSKKEAQQQAARQALLIHREREEV